MRLATSRPARKPSPNRRQRVPPALTRGIERVEAISILDEIPGDLGLTLWRSARNVLLWAETPIERRGALFAGDAARTRRDELARADIDPELRAPLSVFTDLLRDPGRADVLRLVNACRRVAAWAEQRGAMHTVLEFLQAAALVSPDSASLAFLVGRVARKLAEYDRAESWYSRSAVQGRKTGDWRAYASAMAGMGNLYMQRGNYPAARRSHQRCLQVADRHHLRDLYAAANHNLFGMEVDAGVGLEADTLAARALEAYDPEGFDVKRLAYDVAYHWCLQGYFTGALQVALALSEVVDEPSIKPVVHGLVARAAGGTGDAARFDQAAERVDELLSDPAIPGDMAARTLLGLAHGALSLGRTSLAAAYADESASIARKRSEGRTTLEAEAVLEAARREGAASRRVQAPASSAPKLADDFVRVLTSPRAEALVPT